ncbi:MAG: hypothetical protein HN778_13295 [Prolixibacteraceae bacterium]|nr:hypothetical protein [Prolixibacteraceae bacterium]MBT6764908.1 hypothetical protein [Prolixibacteraceae bacterium]MBT7000435.1 hypothetical protein [Prolixibacteraceae bacterium]MBT7395802.1 hypothetical protein [Prolixibacteraceae bacterium]
MRIFSAILVISVIIVSGCNTGTEQNSSNSEQGTPNPEQPNPNKLE